MVKKKSYNPFKMWGSYVGGLLLAIIIVVQNNKMISESIKYGAFFTRKMFGGYNNQLCWDAIAFPIILIIGIILITIIVGFLIGWGIHSLFRRFK